MIHSFKSAFNDDFKSITVELKMTVYLKQEKTC